MRISVWAELRTDNVVLNQSDNECGISLQHLDRNIEVAEGVSPCRHEHRDYVVSCHVERLGAEP